MIIHTWPAVDVGGGGGGKNCMLKIKSISQKHPISCIF